MDIRFNTRLNLPHIIDIYDGLNLIGVIHTEFEQLTLFEPTDYYGIGIISEKIKELKK